MGHRWKTDARIDQWCPCNTDAFRFIRASDSNGEMWFYSRRILLETQSGPRFSLFMEQMKYLSIFLVLSFIGQFSPNANREQGHSMPIWWSGREILSTNRGRVRPLSDRLDDDEAFSTVFTRRDVFPYITDARISTYVPMRRAPDRCVCAYTDGH